MHNAGPADGCDATKFAKCVATATAKNCQDPEHCKPEDFEWSNASITNKACVTSSGCQAFEDKMTAA